MVTTWHWNLQSSSVMMTMKATPARLASTRKMVCSSRVVRPGEWAGLWAGLYTSSVGS